uniref:CSON001938 protein n=1 Tax=Culicoides sonorensis TaxID=179676 RepID=A0A336MI90_CULSO
MYTMNMILLCIQFRSGSYVIINQNGKLFSMSCSSTTAVASRLNGIIVKFCQKLISSCSMHTLSFNTFGN